MLLIGADKLQGLFPLAVLAAPVWSPDISQTVCTLAAFPFATVCTVVPAALVLLAIP